MKLEEFQTAHNILNLKMSKSVTQFIIGQLQYVVYVHLKFNLIF